MPCEALSRLGRADDDGIRRSRPLPRAVREPLPPGRPGEVPGLAARRGLDAREPGPADGGLPARLLRSLADAVRQSGALRALPARRPLGMDLLLGLGAVGVPFPARHREPDPQDTLSPAARALVG